MKQLPAIFLCLVLLFLLGCSESQPPLREVKHEHKPHFRKVYKTIKGLVPEMEAMEGQTEFSPVPSGMKFNFNYGGAAYNADFFSFHYIDDLIYGGSPLGELKRSRQFIYILRDMLVPQVIPEDEAIPYHDVEGVLQARKVRFLLMTKVLATGFGTGKATWIHFLLDVEEGKVLTAFPGGGECLQDEGKSTYNQGEYREYEVCQRLKLGEDANRIAREVLKAPLTTSEEVAVGIN